MWEVDNVMLALTETQENLWWGAIIGGFVVVLAVVALLTMLVLLVRTIEQRVRLIKDTLERAAANTADRPARMPVSEKSIGPHTLKHAQLLLTSPPVSSMVESHTIDSSSSVFPIQ